MICGSNTRTTNKKAFARSPDEDEDEYVLVVVIVVRIY